MLTDCEGAVVLINLKKTKTIKAKIKLVVALFMGKSMSVLLCEFGSVMLQ